MKNFSSFIIVSIIIFGCNSNPNESYDNANKTDTLINQNALNVKVEKQEVQCQCKTEDAEKLASKIINNFNQKQNEIETQYTKTISLYGPIEQRPDCSFIATFQIEDGVTGYNRQLIKKRFKCDGVEIYEQ